MHTHTYTHTRAHTHTHTHTHTGTYSTLARILRPSRIVTPTASPFSMIIDSTGELTRISAPVLKHVQQRSSDAVKTVELQIHFAVFKKNDAYESSSGCENVTKSSSRHRIESKGKCAQDFRLLSSSCMLIMLADRFWQRDTHFVTQRCNASQSNTWTPGRKTRPRWKFFSFHFRAKRRKDDGWAVSSKMLFLLKSSVKVPRRCCKTFSKLTEIQNVPTLCSNSWIALLS